MRKSRIAAIGSAIAATIAASLAIGIPIASADEENPPVDNRVVAYDVAPPSTLTLRQVSPDRRYGAVTFTVNALPNAPTDNARLLFILRDSSESLTPRPPQGADCKNVQSGTIHVCQLPAPAPGATETYRFRYTAPLKPVEPVDYRSQFLSAEILAAGDHQLEYMASNHVRRVTVEYPG